MAIRLVVLSFCLLSVLAVGMLAAMRSGSLGSGVLSRLMLGVRSGVLETPVQLSMAPNVWLEQAKISVRRPTAERASATITTGPGGAPLPPIIGAERIIVDEPRFVYTLSAREEHDLAKADARVLTFLIEPIRNLRFGRLSIRNGSVELIRTDGSRETIRDLFLEVSAARGRMLTAVAGSFVVRGQRISIDATLGAPNGLESPASMPLRLVMSSALFDATFEGSAEINAKLGARGKLDLSLRNLRAFLRWTGHRLGDGPGLEAFRARGEFEWRDASFVFSNAAWVFDSNTATGTLALKIGGERPRIDGTLAFDTLDLAPYAAAFVGAPNDRGSNAGHKQPATAWPALRVFDADLRVSAPAVKGTSLEIGALAASLALRKGQLTADVAEIRIEQGVASGRIVVDSLAGHDRYSARLQLEQVLLTRLAAVAFAPPTIEGRGDLVLELSATGADLATLRATLNGEARLRIPNGGRIWLGLRQIAAEAYIKQSLPWSAAPRGDTSFDELRADLVVKDGRMMTETLTARARGLAIRADGFVNLAVDQVYARIQIERDGGSLPFLSPSRQQQRLVVLGPLANPTINADDNSEAADTDAQATRPVSAAPRKP